MSTITGSWSSRLRTITIPEWQKDYINYLQAKKLIQSISSGQQFDPVLTLSSQKIIELRSLFPESSTLSHPDHYENNLRHSSDVIKFLEREWSKCFEFFQKNLTELKGRIQKVERLLQQAAFISAHKFSVSEPQKIRWTFKNLNNAERYAKKSFLAHMKATLLELHRGLTFLHSFAYANATTLLHIYKKYEKSFGPCEELSKWIHEDPSRTAFISLGAPHYLASSTVSHFGFDNIFVLQAAQARVNQQMQHHSHEEEEQNAVFLLPTLIRETDVLYSELFCNGDRRAAESELALHPRSASRQKRALVNNGILFGAFLTLLSIIIYNLSSNFFEGVKKVPQLHLQDNALRSFRMIFSPLFMLLLFSVATWIFRKGRVNARFVLELDSRHNISTREYFVISFSFLILWACGLFFYTQVVSYMETPDEIQDAIDGCAAEDWVTCPLYYPIVVIIIIVVMTTLPFPIFYHKTRFWFWRIMGRIAAAPFAKVRFPDFFLADLLTSLSSFFVDIKYSVCVLSESVNTASCSFNGSIFFSIFSIWPFWARTMQCIRRYRDSRDSLHLVNVGKYFSSIIAMTVSVIKSQPSFTDQKASLTTAWILLNLFSSTYKLIWDLGVDWSFVNWTFFQTSSWKNVKRPSLLVADICYPRWIYYNALVTNILIRYSWLVPVIIGTAVSSNALDWISYSMGILEVYRRTQWCLFRIEREHIANIHVGKAILAEEDTEALQSFQSSAKLEPLQNVGSKTHRVLFEDNYGLTHDAKNPRNLRSRFTILRGSEESNPLAINSAAPSAYSPGVDDDHQHLLAAPLLAV